MNKKLDTEAAALSRPAYDTWWANYRRPYPPGSHTDWSTNLRQEAFQAGVRAGLAARDEQARHKAD